MKYLFFVFFVLFLNLVSIAQSTSESRNLKIITSREAEYPGGEAELYKDIYIQLKYSEAAKEQKIETTVMLSLFVETDSTVSRVMVLTDPGFGVADSLVSFLNNTRFVPALMNGKPFRTQVMLNVPVRAH